LAARLAGFFVAGADFFAAVVDFFVAAAAFGAEDFPPFASAPS
jgi:hypothetical protein